MFEIRFRTMECQRKTFRECDIHFFNVAERIRFDNILSAQGYCDVVLNAETGTVRTKD